MLPISQKDLMHKYMSHVPYRERDRRSERNNSECVYRTRQRAENAGKTDIIWDVRGTSYPTEEDKMYDLGLLSEANKKIQGQGSKVSHCDIPYSGFICELILSVVEGILDILLMITR